MADVTDALTVRLIAKAGWLLLAGWLLIGRAPGRRWDRLIRTSRNLLAHPAAFGVIAAGSLGMFVLAVAAQHFSLRTSSHDFGLMDEALAGESGGRFMHTEVFGYSLLGEHFYLLMAALVPVRRLVDSPWVTLLAHALVLWAALFPLRAILRHERVQPWLVNFACLMYATHPIAARTLSYVFHPEAAYPACVLALYWCLRTKRWMGYACALLGTLAIKEDAAVYLLGFSVWVGLAHRRPKVALATAAASLVWLGWSLKVWMPAFGAPVHEYRFIARWVEYGATPATIAAGMLANPGLLLADLFGRQPLLMFAGLGGLVFLTRWGWLAFALPWLINATSIEPMQAGFALYYGAPLFAFALPPAIDALRRRPDAGSERRNGRAVPAWPSRLFTSRFAPALPLLVAALNVAHVDLPRPDPDRAAIRRTLEAIPRDEPVRVQPCLYPLGGYWTGKRPLMPGANPEAGANLVVILADRLPWPFTNADLDGLADRLVRSGWKAAPSPVPSLLILRSPGRPDRMGYDRKPR